MTRDQFLFELEGYLAALPYNEKEDAMSYYREYTQEIVDEGGDIIARLGSPRQVAAEVLANAGIVSQPFVPNKKKNNTALIAIICICASPILVPLAIAAIAVAFSLVITVVCVVFAIAVTGFSLLLASVVAVLFGIIAMFSQLEIGILIIGLGFVMLGLGLFFALGGIFAARGLVHLCEKATKKKATVNQEVI